MKRYEAAGGTYYVCPICFNAKKLEGSRVRTVRMAGRLVVRGFTYRSSGSRVPSNPCCNANSVAVDRVLAPVLA